MAKKTDNKTITGTAILELAQRMRKQTPGLSLSDAKKQAKEKIKYDAKRDQLADKLLHGGIIERGRRKVLVKLFGSTIGDKLATLTRDPKEEERASDRLLKHENKDKKEELKPFNKDEHKPQPLPPKEVKQILEKLNSIEKDIKIIKAEKPVDQKVEKAVRPVRNPHYADAAKALRGLQFKPAEVKSMLEGATGNNPEELIKSALTPAHKRIPAPQVAPAVEAAKADLGPVEPQSEAKEAIKSREDLEKERQEHADKQKIIADLDQIKKKIDSKGKGGLLGMILAGLAALFGKFWKPLKEAFEFTKTIIEGMWVLVKRTWSVIGKVWEFVQKIGEGIAAIIRKIPGLAETAKNFLKGLVDSGAAEAGLALGTDAVVMGSVGYMATTMGKDIKNATDKEASKYGLEIMRDPKTGMANGDYKFNGVKVNEKDLTPEEKDIIDASQQANPYIAKQAQAKIKKDPDKYKDPAVDPKMPVIEVKSKKLDEVSSQNSDLKQDAAVPQITQIIENDNRTINPPQQGQVDGSPTFLNVRNLDGTASSYIADLFNHPVKTLGF